MSYLYINENGAVVGIDGNRFTVRYKDGMLQSIPAENLEGITVLGAVQITTQCMRECFERGVPVSYFSKGGKYFGRAVSTGHIRAELQRKQCELYNSDFALTLSKRIIDAKIHNQLIVLRRYARSTYTEIADIEKMMKIAGNKCSTAAEINELMGYEGLGARYYFDGLSRCIDDDFKFKGRSKRPPLDEFNSMISLGYSILMNEIYGSIESKGLNPYFGFMHRDAEKHPTLASDMMEEWRAVLVDATVMSMINGHEVLKEEFYSDMDMPGIYLSKEALKKYINKLERKFQTDNRYLSYVDYYVSFRSGISLQMNRLVKAIESGDAELYEPIRIR